MPTLEEIDAELKRRVSGLSLESIEQELNKRQSEGVPLSKGIPQQALQGLTANFGDEITAALTAIPAAFATGTGVGEAYDDILSNLRREQKQFQDDHPVISFTAQVAGGALTGGAGTVKALGKSTLPIATKAAIGGATTGAASGIGAGETLEQRVKGGAVGAIAGGTIGAVTPAAQTLAIKAGSYTKKAISRAFTTQENRALRTLATKMDAQDVDAIKAAALIRKGGDESSLADIENFKGVAKALASDPSQTKVTAKAFLNNRLKGTKARLRSLVTARTGAAVDNVESEVERIAAEMSERAAPLYREAYLRGLPGDAAENLNNMAANNETIKRALKLAVGEIRDDLRLDPQFKVDLDVDNPSIIMWDYAQRTLADTASALSRGGKMQKAGRIFDTQGKIVEELHKNTILQDARSIWRGGKQAQEALEIGTDIFKEARKRGAASLASDFNSLNPQEQQLARLGMGSEMMKVINNTADTIEGRPAASIIRNLYGDDNKKAAISLFFGGNRRDVASFARNLRNERDYIKSANDILGNSNTAEKLAEQAALTVDASGAADIASGLRSGNPIGAGMGVIKAIGRVFDGKNAKDAANRELSRRLFTSDRNLILDTLEGIQRETNILPEWAQQITGADSLSRFLSSPDNAEKLSLFIAGTLSGRIVGAKPGE